MARVEQGSPEWHELRRRHIGASDAAVILGISPWKTPYELWCEKLGYAEAEKENYAMRRGKNLEEEAREYFGNEMGIVFFDDVKVSDEFPFLMASLDGIDLDRKIAIEIKCLGLDKHVFFTENGDIPDFYISQMQHQMRVYDLDQMYFGSYYPGHKCRPILVKRDQAFLDIYIPLARKFWDYHILQEVPPELTEKDYVLINSNEWKKATERWIYAKNNLTDAQILEDYARDELLKFVQNERCKGAGVKCQIVKRKGAISYDKIPELAGVDLEAYRKKGTEYWKISIDGILDTENYHEPK